MIRFERHSVCNTTCLVASLLLSNQHVLILWYNIILYSPKYIQSRVYTLLIPTDSRTLLTRSRFFLALFWAWRFFLHVLTASFIFLMGPIVTVLYDGLCCDVVRNEKQEVDWWQLFDVIMRWTVEFFFLRWQPVGGSFWSFESDWKFSTAGMQPMLLTMDWIGFWCNDIHAGSSKSLAFTRAWEVRWIRRLCLRRRSWEQQVLLSEKLATYCRRWGNKGYRKLFNITVSITYLFITCTCAFFTFA